MKFNINMKLAIIFSYFLLICAVQAGDGGLAIAVEPNDAEIYVDGQLKANISPAHIIVSEGKHQIEVKKAGMKTEQFEIVITAENTVVKKLTLSAEAPPAPVVEMRMDLLNLLQPERGKFETEAEFWERRTKLVTEFNQKVAARQADFQIGTATLDYENYDLDSGTFPVKIELAEWAKKFIQPFQRNVAALRDDAKNLWQEGEKKPLFAYFRLDKRIAEVDKMVLIGLGKEWRVEVVTGHLFAAFPNFFKELFEQIGVGYKTKFPYIQLHPATVKTENFVNKFIANEANIIISYREMSKDEISTFEKKYDYKPLGIRIALKVYAFYVHKDNPLKGMDGTVQAAFSAPGACPKMTGNLQTWGHFSSTLADILKMESWKNIPIVPYSIKKDSLSYQMVKESLACNGQFSPAMKFVTEQQFAEFISNDKNSIGFAELQQLDPALSVRALPFYNPKQAGLFSSGMIEPSVANARSDEYSLAQNIWIYVNKPPKSTLPPVEHEFIKFIFSPEGNDILEKQKFVPLSQGKRAEELEKLKSE